MEMQGKVWGSTVCLIKLPTVELYRLQIKAGGYCSEHLHRAKHNFFHVESGVIVVRVWAKDGGVPDVTVLRPGDSMSVDPGFYHRFEATRDAVVYELYWAELSEDIERRTQGGVEANRDAP